MPNLRRVHFSPATRLLAASLTLLATQAALNASSPETVPVESAAPRPARREVIAQLAAKLESTYVNPETGARYAAMLRARLAQGAYDDLTDAGVLAAKLTADLQAVEPDGHLRVALESELQMGPRRVRRDPAHAPEGPAPAENFRPRTRRPPMEDEKWISEGVAYVRFNEFPSTPESVAAVDRFMQDHATARAIIIDARTLRGGSIGEMTVMLPYLYGRETTLVAMDVSSRIANSRGPLPEDSPAMRAVKAPPGISRREHFVLPHSTEHRLFAAKICYLISPGTASAGEHLALAFKRTHRAVLIGEHTAGANHFGGFEPLGQGFAVFLPVGRTIDPDTGKDWEGAGIEPDIIVPADQALDVALRRLANNEP